MWDPWVLRFGITGLIVGLSFVIVGMSGMLGYYDVDEAVENLKGWYQLAKSFVLREPVAPEQNQAQSAAPINSIPITNAKGSGWLIMDDDPHQPIIQMSLPPQHEPHQQQ